MKRIAGVLVGSSFLLVAGCGGSSGGSGPSAYNFAFQACQNHGAAAASLAARAAKLDPKYQQLATDEAAAAQNQALTGSGSDDADQSGLTGLAGTGTGSSTQVLDDCAHLATSLIPGVH
jgi:hypothetical protein